MDTIIAIAMLCQTTSSGVSRPLTTTHNFQLECQKYYVDCYFNKTKHLGEMGWASASAAGATLFSSASAQKYLYECVKEKQPLTKY
jgi:hypothetical protein